MQRKRERSRQPRVDAAFAVEREPESEEKENSAGGDDRLQAARRRKRNGTASPLRQGDPAGAHGAANRGRNRGLDRENADPGGVYAEIQIFPLVTIEHPSGGALDSPPANGQSANKRRRKSLDPGEPKHRVRAAARINFRARN